MSGLVAPEIPGKIGVFRHVRRRSFAPFTGFLWSICGPFLIGAIFGSAERQSGKQGLAAQMVTDHTKTSTELKVAAMKIMAEVPAALDSSHQSKLDKLNHTTLTEEKP